MYSSLLKSKEKQERRSQVQGICSSIHRGKYIRGKNYVFCSARWHTRFSNDSMISNMPLGPPRLIEIDLLPQWSVSPLKFFIPLISNIVYARVEASSATDLQFTPLMLWGLAGTQWARRRQPRARASVCWDGRAATVRGREAVMVSATPMSTRIYSRNWRTAWGGRAAPVCSK